MSKNGSATPLFMMLETTARLIIAASGSFADPPQSWWRRRL
jgi:hypothetical protein